MSTEAQSKRAIVEYRMTPFDEVNGKPKVYQRVIEDVATQADVEKIFWYRPIWPRGTRKVEILSITWPDETE